MSLIDNVTQEIADHLHQYSHATSLPECKSELCEMATLNRARSIAEAVVPMVISDIVREVGKAWQSAWIETDFSKPEDVKVSGDLL